MNFKSRKNRKLRFIGAALGTLANIEVGIAGRANDLFTVPLSLVKEYGLRQYAKPMVRRSMQANSAMFEEDSQKNRLSKARAHLLVFPTRRYWQRSGRLKIHLTG
ncbi:MAG TPA: hypothetical protein VFR58_16355 [Flavisolibacter sp.]|nr:hypothetical protein [Flavisolibacter sp.]